MGTRKTKKVKRRQLPCTVAIEISREEVAMVIVDKKADDQREMRGHRSTWLRDASSLHSDQGIDELTAALVALADQEKLAGGTVNVALSSDFCVTRVLAGETDKMMSDLRGLRERTAHYLTLGAGPKEVSECIRSLDVKNSQAWLTVTNQETLDNVLHALENAGLYPGLVEHSMVGLCRAVGRMGGDMTSPVIIIEPSDRGVDLGISYRGQLLFDYRPGGIHSKEHVAEIVEKHLERIQRYCTRFFRFASGQIGRVYLVGHHEDAEFVKSQFATSTRLNAEVLNPALICPEWHCESKLVGDPDFLAALGSALIEEEKVGLPASERGFPDLMDVLRSRRRDPIWPGVRRHLWPVAAAAAVGLLVYGAAMVKHVQASGAERLATKAEDESALANTIKLELEQAAVRGKYLQTIDRELINPPVHELVANVWKNKPERVFLDRISVDPDGTVTFEGKSETSELVFDFESRLKKIHLLKNVSVQSQTPARLPTIENATGFQIKCKFSDNTDRSERQVRNG